MSITTELLKPKKELHVHILEPEKFNKLPYNDVDISMGLANPKTGHAYIKKSGIPALDLLVIGHEINELVSKVSEHEENGIRYKKGGVLRNIVPWIVGMFNPWLGAIANIGMGQYAQSRHPNELGQPGFGSALMQGVTGYFGGKALGNLGAGASAGWNAAGQSGAGLLGKLGGAAQGGLWGTAGTGANTYSLLGAGSKPVGLLGAGTTFGNLMNNPIGKTAAQMLGGQMLNGGMAPAASMPNETIRYYGQLPQIPQSSTLYNNPLIETSPYSVNQEYLSSSSTPAMNDFENYQPGYMLNNRRSSVNSWI